MWWVAQSRANLRIVQLYAGWQPRYVLDNQVYVIGGQDVNSRPLNTVEVFDLATNSWTPRPSRRTCRKEHGVATLNDFIYAVGGHDGLMQLATVVRYNNQQDTMLPSMDTLAREALLSANTPDFALDWLSIFRFLLRRTSDIIVDEFMNVTIPPWTKVTPMCTPRSGVGDGVLNELLYAVGGRNGNQHLNTVERYDPITIQWDQVPDMTMARSGVGVAELEGRLYAVGGQDNSRTVLKSVEVYCPRQCTWSPVSDMMLSRWHPGVVSFDGRLFVIGGDDGHGIDHSSVEVYNPQTNKWSILGVDMSIGRFGYYT